MKHVGMALVGFVLIAWVITGVFPDAPSWSGVNAVIKQSVLIIVGSILWAGGVIADRPLLRKIVKK